MSKRVQLAFTVIALGALATVGLWDGSRGVLLPHFLSDLRLSATVGGAVFSASALGYLANSLSFGYLSQRFGLKRLVVAGVALFGCALALFLTQRSPVSLYLANIGLGAGISMVELSTSIQISLIYRDRQGGMLNLLHGFFGAGALAGSLWAAMWLGLGAGWRIPFALAGGIIVFWAGYYLTLPVGPMPKEDAVEPGYGPLLRDPLVWIAAVALGSAVAGEVGAALWMPYYLQRVKGFSDVMSAGYLTAYFAGFTAMRLAGAWVVERLGQVRSVVSLALVGVASLAALLLLPGASLWMPVLAGAGVATGFATCTALVATRYPGRVNQVYTVMYSSGGVAGIVTAPFMGWLGDWAGMTVSMWVPLLSYLLLALLMAGFGVAPGRRHGQEPTEAALPR